MGVEFRKNLFGMVCLSSAVGLLLYWVMFMSILPRVMRPGALSTMPLLSGVVGAIVIVLFYLAFSSLITFTRGKPRETLVLKRGPRGVSVGWSEVGSTAMPEARPKAKERPKKRASPRSRKYSGAIPFGIAASVLLVLGIFATGWVPTPLAVVSSGSMAPAFNRGDLVILWGRDADGIDVGDVIAFRAPNPYEATVQSPVLHRVIGKFDRNGEIYFETRGDANPSPDPWEVPAPNLVGECAARIPYLGLPILFAKNIYGLASLLCLAIASFVLAEVGGRKDEG